ncbi:chloride channel protein, partial [Phormidium pseudopriestleyi FRX01]
AAVFLKQGVGWLGGWRIYASFNLPSWIGLPMIGLIGGAIAGFLVERFATEASGSGIPQVKAALAGFPLSLDLRVAFIKLISTVITVGSGLTLGRQGPTVQIGAAIAAEIGRWFPTSPDYRRQLIAAGAAAGLAAGFNAPLAGVLFAVEELLHDISAFSLGPAILASFIGAVVSRILGGKSLDLNLSATGFQSQFTAPEIPFYLILGILSGLLGTLFTQGIVASIKFNRKVLRVPLPWRMGLAGLICGVAIALLPPLFRNNSGLREFLITGSPTAGASAIAFLSHFCLTIIAAGSGAPGGLFAPSLILGSALGYLVGIWQFAILGAGLPTTYALAGMGAFFCAVSKAPITAVVMIFEITTDFNLVLPLMIVSVVSYLVAEMAESGSLYDKLLKLNGIDLKEEATPNAILSEIRAADVMQRRVETLSCETSIEEVVQAFSRSHHRGFPVVDDGKLVGMVAQSDLAKISKLNLPPDTILSKIMTPEAVKVSPRDTLMEVLFQLNRYSLSRVPVTEGRKLVGIITRTDIIRAESDHLTGKQGFGPHPEASYLVYQTRSPATGQGRLLVPLANPETAPALLRWAVAIAHQRNYEVECLQIIVISRHQSPDETAVKTIPSRRLLRLAERMGRDWNVPVHTQVRVAHDVAQAMLETIDERHIDLVLMGWKGSTGTPGRIFGNVADTMIRQAPCDVILVKMGKTAFPPSPRKRETPRSGKISVSTTAGDRLASPKLSFQRWLVPIRGGPSGLATVKLLPGLVSMTANPEIRLCQVFGPGTYSADPGVLDQALAFLERQVSCPVISTSLCANSVQDALIDLAQKDQCDVIVLGASREGLLHSVVKGNIPEAIASNCDCTVMLVRTGTAS